MIDFALGHYAYWFTMILMVIGLYGMMFKKNLIKKVVSLAVFQSAIILFFLGSGPVKGFAVTLGLGILTTLFSAYFFGRHLSSFFVLIMMDTIE